MHTITVIMVWHLAMLLDLRVYIITTCTVVAIWHRKIGSCGESMKVTEMKLM
jgi:hypothetical protein